MRRGDSGSARPPRLVADGPRRVLAARVRRCTAVRARGAVWDGRVCTRPSAGTGRVLPRRRMLWSPRQARGAGPQGSGDASPGARGPREAFGAPRSRHRTGRGGRPRAACPRSRRARARRAHPDGRADPDPDTGRRQRRDRHRPDLHHRDRQPHRNSRGEVLRVTGRPDRTPPATDTISARPRRAPACGCSSWSRSPAARSPCSPLGCLPPAAAEPSLSPPGDHGRGADPSASRPHHARPQTSARAPGQTIVTGPWKASRQAATVASGS